jgi:hypothetical protein
MISSVLGRSKGGNRRKNRVSLDFVALLIERLVIVRRAIFRLLVEGMQGLQLLLARSSLNQLLS